MRNTFRAGILSEPLPDVGEFTVVLETLDEAVEAGLAEPASLHPVIDPKKRVGYSSASITTP